MLYERDNNNCNIYNLLVFISKFQEYLTTNRIKTLAGEIYANVVISDTGQVYLPNANPNRGYHNSIRTIMVSETCDSLQKEVFRTFITKYLAQHNMWFYDKTVEKSNIWEFNYGYDSGD